MDIKLPNGLYITAQQNEDPNYPYELFVGITDENDEWLQLLAVIRYDEKYGNQIEVMLYDDADKDWFTEQFKINFRSENN